MASSSSENKEPNPSICRFLPSDEVLIRRYLLGKVLNRPPPRGHVIETFDLYSHHPNRFPFNEIEDSLIEGEMYIFMENREGYENSIIEVDGGVWVQVTAEAPVLSDKLIHVGFRKDRIFESGISGEEVNTKWTVNEFRVNFKALKVCEETIGKENEAQKWIACRIIKRSVKSNVKGGLKHMETDVNESLVMRDLQTRLQGK